MSKPTSNDMITLKRLGRYLVGKPRVVNCLSCQNVPTDIHCFVDADWAGCVRTRRSTSGGGIKFGTHMIKTWTGTQASIALSSGESEYYALVKGVSQGLGTQALFGDFGIKVELHVHTDSSAAKGITERVGLGKTRHIAVHLLWIQQHLRNKTFVLYKVAGDKNPADMFTKHVSEQICSSGMAQWRSEYCSGRSESAPQGQYS